MSDNVRFRKCSHLGPVGLRGLNVMIDLKTTDTPRWFYYHRLCIIGGLSLWEASDSGWRGATDVHNGSSKWSDHFQTSPHEWQAWATQFPIHYASASDDGRSEWCNKTLIAMRTCPVIIPWSLLPVWGCRDEGVGGMKPATHCGGVGMIILIVWGSLLV
jgi:hypothetical protein